ncbi:hypothetical protein LA66_14860 [Aureimonas altamirensis]|uniref:HdeD protein n=1 Tax=Aureimonas altamirensis TaxID=370622 RepID=A0A0B1Q3C7_9HYPH|nr:HdeD family acid-resistance protein [Aureimonas altamirensis]KHJ53871.1 hypothetical protein LA66_14860 [Aureimonas altamirensis]
MALLNSLNATREDLDLLRSRWGWLLAAGIALVTVGLLALANVLLATVASVFFVGAMMLVGGAVQIIYAFKVTGRGQFVGWLLIGALYVVAGLFTFGNPLLASTILTLLFALSIIAAGTIRIVTGFALRPAQGWGWLVLAGVLALIVGAVVIAGWPVNSLWLIGALLAFDLLFNGLAMIIFAFALRRRSQEHA